jgi:hypothetical protein
MNMKIQGRSMDIYIYIYIYINEVDILKVGPNCHIPTFTFRCQRKKKKKNNINGHQVAAMGADHVH